jgi:hypothetical protein
LRQDNESIAKKALEWNPQEGRRKGRARITWRSGVRMEAEHQGKRTYASLRGERTYYY